MGKREKNKTLTIKSKYSAEEIEKRLNDLGIPYKKIEESYQIYLKSNLMNDKKFREVAKSIGAIQEILRTILNDPNLKVIKNLSQRDYSEAIFHGIILDCEVMLGTGEIVNIEIQNSFGDDQFYRMSYIQSVIRVENAPKDKNFESKDLRRIISIMICSKDIVGNGKAISEFVLKEKDDNTIIDNGIRQLYVNINAKTDDKKLAELFKVFKTSTYLNVKIFPELSKAKDIANKLERGNYMMLNSDSLEFYDLVEANGIKKGEARGEEKGRNTLIKDLIKNGTITLKEAETKYGYKKKKTNRKLATMR